MRNEYCFVTELLQVHHVVHLEQVVTFQPPRNVAQHDWFVMHIGPRCNCGKSLFGDAHAWFLSCQVVLIGANLFIKIVFLRSARCSTSKNALRSEYLQHFCLRFCTGIKLMTITYKLIDVLFRTKVPLLGSIIMAFRALFKVLQ